MKYFYKVILVLTALVSVFGCDDDTIELPAVRVARVKSRSVAAAPKNVQPPPITVVTEATYRHDTSQDHILLRYGETPPEAVVGRAYLKGYKRPLPTIPVGENFNVSIGNKKYSMRAFCNFEYRTQLHSVVSQMAEMGHKQSSKELMQAVTEQYCPSSEQAVVPRQPFRFWGQNFRSVTTDKAGKRTCHEFAAYPTSWKVFDDLLDDGMVCNQESFVMDSCFLGVLKE